MSRSDGTTVASTATTVAAFLPMFSIKGVMGAFIEVIPVVVTAALLGQHPLPADAAAVVADKLELDADAAALLQTIPMRGSLEQGVPTDPTVNPNPTPIPSHILRWRLARRASRCCGGSSWSSSWAPWSESSSDWPSEITSSHGALKSRWPLAGVRDGGRRARLR